ncbi:MAG: helix-turn-helix transcriptional regulator [Acidimicrobiales bacterium]|nr:MAG: helix-turn-helix transcriptional regulator [Acidimicrobiales bacterium]
MEEAAPFIVPTKLALPTPRGGRVERSRLNQRLDGCFEQPASVALVCAPAGWGKSTLLSQWLNEIDAPVAWVQLDPADNDETRLCAHVATATSRALGARSGDVFTSATTVSQFADTLAAVLSPSAEFVLVLDDYHVIANPEIHTGVDRLLKWMPASGHLVVSTRMEPPLVSLSRLRVDGRLVEVRADDLAFSDAEADQLLSEAISVPVAADVVSGINARAEGWGAGLYLAALSIGRDGDADDYLTQFAGDTRLVADYLRSELIDGQTAEVRELLMSIAVLDEFCGGLCDAVLETTGSAKRLRELERDNLLLVPLDERSEWYRFHHLLLEWLRDELSVSDIDTVELHRRAAVWLHASCTPEAAFDHAHAASEVDLAASIVVENWGQAVAAGRWALLNDWFDRLGNDVVSSRPRLCLARARVGLNSGESPAWVTAWMDRAREVIGDDEPELLAEVHRNLGIQLRMQGEMSAAQQHLEAAVEVHTDGDKLVESQSLLAAVLFYQGDLKEAGRLLEVVLETATVEDNHLTVLFALSFQSAVLYERGLRIQAKETAENALGSADGTTLDGSPTLLWARLVLGHLWLDDGDVDQAAAEIEPTLEMSRLMNARGAATLALVAAARLEAARRHKVQAQALLGEADELVVSMTDPGRLPELVAVARGQTLRGERRDPHTPDNVVIVEDLTDRELAVLRLLPSDLTGREISAELYVSHNTTKGHLKAIYRKLGVSSRDQCVARARGLGLL